VKLTKAADFKISEENVLATARCRHNGLGFNSCHRIARALRLENANSSMSNGDVSRRTIGKQVLRLTQICGKHTQNLRQARFQAGHALAE
jgi:hypothetical protein